jgi:hypothetical protein
MGNAWRGPCKLQNVLLQVPNLLGIRSLYMTFLAHTQCFTTMGHQFYSPWDIIL